MAMKILHVLAAGLAPIGLVAFPTWHLQHMPAEAIEGDRGPLILLDLTGPRTGGRVYWVFSFSCLCPSVFSLFSKDGLQSTATANQWVPADPAMPTSPSFARYPAVNLSISVAGYVVPFPCPAPNILFLARGVGPIPIAKPFRE